MERAVPPGYSEDASGRRFWYLNQEEAEMFYEGKTATAERPRVTKKEVEVPK